MKEPVHESPTVIPRLGEDKSPTAWVYWATMERLATCPGKKLATCPVPRLSSRLMRQPIIRIMIYTTHYGLRITDYGLRITDYALRITHYALRITHYGLRITHEEIPR